MEVLVVIPVILFIVWFSYSSQQARKKEQQTRCQQYEVVKATSTYYRDLQSLNNQYCFYSDFPLNRTLLARVYSKQKFDTYNFDELLERHLRSSMSQYAVIIQHIESNQKMYQIYLQKVQQLHSSINNEQAMSYKIPLSTYQLLEHRLVQGKKLEPKTTMRIICKASYTSTKGKSNYQKEKSYSLSDIKAHYQSVEAQLKNESAKEYQQKYERSKMSASLRYTVLRRDGFRCQICGATQADGVKLHVDHIVPISKGGKTELSNFRTLCEQCNLGKGNKSE